MDSFIIGFSASELKWPIVSWLIRLIQGTKFSHSYLKLYLEKYGRWIIIDATSKGVRFRNVTEFYTENREREAYLIYTSEEKIDALFDWGLNRLGEHYSYKEVFGNLIQAIFKFFGKKIKNPFGQGGKVLRCNELVLLALKEVFEIEIGLDIDSADLNDLKAILMKMEGVKKLI